jgi:uncharacterized membrane protein YfcA
MFELIKDILLSQYLMVIVLITLLLMVTSWALRQREYAGYALGWLMGILLIIIYQTVSGGDANTGVVEEVVETTAEAATEIEPGGEPTLSFLGAVIPSILGIIFGYGLLFFMNTLNMTHRRRSISIALFTTLLVLGLYLSFGLTDRSSQLLGVFALALAIGALLNIVLNSTPVPTRYQVGATIQQAQQALPLDPLSGEPPAANLRTQQQRFDRLRRQNRPPR